MLRILPRSGSHFRHSFSNQLRTWVCRQDGAAPCHWTRHLTSRRSKLNLEARILELSGSARDVHQVDTELSYCPERRLMTVSSIGDSDDPLERILAVLRFWFTKDLVSGNPDINYTVLTITFRNMSRENLANRTTQAWASFSGFVARGTPVFLADHVQCKWVVKDIAPPILGAMTKASQSQAESPANSPVTVSYLTEQTSHHPPVSAFYIDCPAMGISARGFDQLSAKFTGTSIRVTPGAHNLGIFVTVHSRGNEEYQLTHPAAQLGGLLRGSPSVTVADTCYITCPQTRMKVILHYLEEGWLSKTQNRVVGVIYKYDPESDRRTRIKDVPQQEVLATLEGCWHRQVYFTLAGSTVWSKPHLWKGLVLIGYIGTTTTGRP